MGAKSNLDRKISTLDMESQKCNEKRNGCKLSVFAPIFDLACHVSADHPELPAASGMQQILLLVM